MTKHPPVAVVVSFFICWVPFHAQRLLASYLVKDENQNQLLLDIYLKLTYVSGVMYYLSSTINPLLYQLMSAKFRLAFKETFKCSLFRCARFGVGRSKLTASQQHSPTNSLKENQNNPANGTHHHPHRSAFLASQQPCLARLDSKSSQFSQCSTTAAIPAIDCSTCATNPIACSDQLDPQTDKHASRGAILTRLHSRLNTSLMSLFRLNSNVATRCCGCPCCSTCAKTCCNPSSQQSGAPNFRLEAARNLRHQHSSSPCGASTPLLADHLEVAPTSGFSSAQLNARTFTFVRGLQPVKKHQQQQQQSSLTRLSSREEEQEKEQQPVEASGGLVESSRVSADPRMAELIQPTGEPGVEFNELSRCVPASLATTSPATSDSCPGSSGSSPDQIAHISHSRLSARPDSSRSTGTGSAARRCARQQSYQPAPGSSSCSSNNEPVPAIDNLEQPLACSPKGRVALHGANDTRLSAKRRRSLGSHQPAHLGGQADQEEPAELHINQRPAARLATSNGLEQRRRKSSSSSAYQRYFSSSLSSSDRQLDKKLSLSTTTSALDDYTGSYTTTNSVLTGAGSNPNLFTTNFDPAQANSAEEAAEETVVPVRKPLAVTDGETVQAFSVDDDLSDNLIANEVKLPLRLAR